jgi:hypothetical protein
MAGFMGDNGGDLRPSNEVATGDEDGALQGRHRRRPSNEVSQAMEMGQGGAGINIILLRVGSPFTICS